MYLNFLAIRFFCDNIKRMKKKINKTIEQNLKGLRYSKNRDSVICLLSKTNVPISIEDIFYKVKEENSKISLSTIYRIIDKLVSLKIVRKSVMDGNKALYELEQRRHHHYIICTKCKKMAILDSCPISELEQKILNDTGFYITGHKYEIYGECKDCHNK